MEITNIETGRGPLLSLLHGNERVAVFFPDEAMEGDTKEPMSQLAPPVIDYVGFVTRNWETYQPDLVPAQNDRMAGAVKAAVKSAQAALLSEKRNFEMADARAREPGPLSDAPWEAEYRASIAALELPQRIAAVSEMTFSQSSALIRQSSLDGLGLPPEVRELVMHRHLVNGHIARTGLSANYARRPTAADPLATGVDSAAAFAAGEVALSAHKKRSDRLELAADTLRSTVALIALTTDQSADAVWAGLTA